MPGRMHCVEDHVLADLVGACYIN